MVQMKRNLNLEEIGNEGLFGLDALKYQSIWQKLIFFGSSFVAVVVSVILPLAIDVPKIVMIASLMIFLSIAVLFGCNYKKDISFFKYLKIRLKKPSKEYVFGSYEDIRRIKENQERIKKEEDELLVTKEQREEEHKRTLKMMIVVFVIIAVVMASILGLVAFKNKKSIHHEAKEEVCMMSIC